MWGSFPPCSWPWSSSPSSCSWSSSDILIGFIPLLASTILISLPSTVFKTESIHSSMPSPLYTNILVFIKSFKSFGFGSKLCASLPSGIIENTSTLSPPIASVKSFRGLIVTPTLNFSPSFSLLLFTHPEKENIIPSIRITPTIFFFISPPLLQMICIIHWYNFIFLYYYCQYYNEI